MSLRFVALAALPISVWVASAAIAQAANPDHVQRLLKSNQCPLCDLSGVNLSETNLFGANSEQAALTDVAVQLPAQTKAMQSVDAMNRAQQAYFFEKKQFATSLAELQLEAAPGTQAYLYRIFAYPDRQKVVMVAGVPKKNGLKTYVALVNVSKNTDGETTTFSILCESKAAKPTLPRLPSRSRLPTVGALSCPANFQPVYRRK